MSNMKKLFGCVLVAIPMTVVFIGGVATNGLGVTIFAWLCFGVAMGMIYYGLSLIDSDKGNKP